MENLLFISVGIPTKSKKTAQACGALVIICGVILIVIAQLKRKSWGGHEYYMLEEDARTMLMLIGVIACIVGVILLIAIMRSPVNHARLSLYETYLTGVQARPYQEFTIAYKDVTGVEISPVQTNLLIIKTAITTYTVPTENITFAHKLLCEKVMENNSK